MGTLKQWMLCLCIAALLLPAIPSPRAGEDPETAGATLQKAWEEYGFQNWEAAARLFLQAKADKSARESQKIQAEIGEICVIQYRAPGQDPVMGLKRWDEFLARLPKDHALRPFSMMHQAYCHLVKRPADYEKARAIYLEALELVPDKKATIGQELILNYLSTYLMRYDEAQVALGMKEADIYLPLTDGTPFSTSAHGLAAGMAMILKDYPRAATEYQAQYEAGILTRSYLEATLYRLARINEIHLRNYDEAARYFELLVKEVPTSGRGYYARMRAAELRKGIFESKLFEVGGDVDRDLQGSLPENEAGTEPEASHRPAASESPATTGPAATGKPVGDKSKAAAQDGAAPAPQP